VSLLAKVQSGMQFTDHTNSTCVQFGGSGLLQHVSRKQEPELSTLHATKGVDLSITHRTHLWEVFECEQASYFTSELQNRHDGGLASIDKHVLFKAPPAHL
jgi:hypothetical protein